jgi:predicted TIM-barrel fold metal-dependent hydrolase
MLIISCALRPLPALPYAAAFSEGQDPVIRNYHARYTLCYRRSLRDLGRLLDCEPTEIEIASERTQLGLEALTQKCFRAANLSGIILDDGCLPETTLPWHWHQQFVPVYRLLRLEWLAEQLFPKTDSFETFINQFRFQLDTRPKTVVGFKSIAAYRTGLDIQPVSEAQASETFYALKETGGEKPLRLGHKPLIDYLLLEALKIAARSTLPVQFHTGFGDPDLDLRLVNPLHLRPLLEDPRFRTVPIVLLHAAYPFSREAGYLASVYPQVYVDFGLAVPFLSVAGMTATLRMLLELTPTSKLLYSSDAHFIPELYYLGAKWGREILGRVLTAAVVDGDLTERQVVAIATTILQDNAKALYGL